MNKRNEYLKIGEIARMTGSTVRTLHYYDEVGLLKPTQITEAGHRLYGIECVTKLYQITAMKNMGFNLEEISELIRTKNIDILKFIEVQISNVKEEIARKQLLFGKLLKLEKRFKVDQSVSMNDLAEIIPFISSSADKHFTKEQLDKLKNNQKKFGLKPGEALEWLVFIRKLEYCYENKLPITDSNAIECVDYWNNLTDKLIGEDEQLRDSISSFHASLEDSHLRYGLTDELYKYLMKLTE